MRCEQGIVRVARLDCRLEPFDWIFARQEAARLDANWEAHLRAKPSLYDGRVLLAHSVRLGADVLQVSFFETGFKSFLGWQDFGFLGPPIANCFAMAAIRSADGAFMLGEMSPGTANAGRLYFPSGTPDLSDVRDGGRVDLDSSVSRELTEETGLHSDEVEIENGWTIVFDGPSVACMKEIRSRANAAELQQRLADHNANGPEPELSRLVPVRSPADYDSGRMSSFVLRYIDDVLANDGTPDQAR